MQRFFPAAVIALCVVSALLVSVQADRYLMVHVTDVHGWINGHPHNETLNADYGDFASLLEHMYAMAEAEGYELMVFDSGDLIEGTGLSDATPIHGQYIFPIVDQVKNFTALTMGNHDAEHADTVQLMEDSFIPSYNGEGVPQNEGRYLTANVHDATNSTFIGEPYTLYKTKYNTTILIIGWLYNFTQASYALDVNWVSNAVEQEWFAAAMAIPDIDMIISVMHIDPTTPPEIEQIYDAIRSYHPNTPYIMFSGHRHILYFQWYDINSFTIESGKYFEEIGLVSFNLTSDGLYSDFHYEWVPCSRENFYVLANKTSEDFLTPAGVKIKEEMAYYSKLLDLNSTVGCSMLTYSPYIPTLNPLSLYNLYIQHVIPTMLFSESVSTNDLYFACNTATLRYDLYQGRVDVNDIYTVVPFNDHFVYFAGLSGTQLSQFVEFIMHQQNSDRFVRYEGPTVEVRPNEPRSLLEQADFTHSLAPINPEKKYDLVCASYDAYDFSIWLGEMFYGNQEVPYHPYPTSYDLTGVWFYYLTEYMPCSDTCVC